MPLPGLKLTLLLAISLLLLACTSTVLPRFGMEPDAQLFELALSGEPLLGRPVNMKELPDRDLFELTPAMKAFADKHTKGLKGKFAKAEALHRALLNPTEAGGHGITYTAFTTLSGGDTFERRQANCLSFTFLYVTLARYLGLDAHVNEVKLPPTWDLRNENDFLFLRHVNAKVILRRDEVVIDLELERYDVKYKQALIPELLAAAQYYNNRGMELSTLGDVHNAFLHLRKALQLNDQQSYIWNNLATIYRRNGFYVEAEALYLHGLKLDDRDLTIISNLGGLYRQMGDIEKADDFTQRAEKHRRINPYYMYYEALRAMDNDRPEVARDLLKKAIRAEENEIRFYELIVKAYEALGDKRGADRMRERLEIQRKARLLPVG